MRLAHLLLFSAVASGAIADPLTKIKALPNDEEKHWVTAVKDRATGDGATVSQVLSFVQKLRPREFKVGDITVGYNGGSGTPESVLICYWIGMKRLPDDAYCNIGYDVKSDGKNLTVSVPKNEVGIELGVEALERGRDAFLAYIDGMYQDTCLDAETHKKIC